MKLCSFSFQLSVPQPSFVDFGPVGSVTRLIWILFIYLFLDTEKFYSVYVNYNGKDFLLCSLAPSAGIYQVALGLQFETGAKLEFRVEGGGSASRVCLTGYTISSQGTPLIPTVVSTPISSSAIGIPIKVQQSILVSDKKKVNANQMQKRVSIRDEHEEKTFDKESGDEDDDELDSDEDEDYDEMIEEFPSDSDEDNMFDLDDSDDEGDTDELEMQQGNLEDEEESTFYGTVALANGNAEAAKVDKKKKKKQKLDFSEAESPSPKVGKAKDDKMTSTPPTKKQKLDGSKNKTPPEVMQTPEMKKKPKAPSSAGNTPMKMLTKSMPCKLLLNLKKILQIFLISFNLKVE